MKKLLLLKPSMHHFQIMKKNKVGEIMKSFDCENMVNFRVEFNKGNMAYEMEKLTRTSFPEEIAALQKALMDKYDDMCLRYQQISEKSHKYS